MFFVDDDQAGCAQRYEHRRTGADHDFGGAVARQQPGVEPFPVAQTGMQHRQRSRQPFPEAIQQLGSQADFRHQHQRLPSAFQHRFDQAQINLGFAAAGNAFQQEDLKLLQLRQDRRDRRRLSVVQGRRRAERRRLRRTRRFGGRDGFHPAFFAQRPQKGGAIPCDGAEGFGGDPGGTACQIVQQPPLGGGATQARIGGERVAPGAADPPLRGSRRRQRRLALPQ